MHDFAYTILKFIIYQSFANKINIIKIAVSAICVPDRMKCNNGEKCAVPCDGITECAGGEDENGCKSK